MPKKQPKRSRSSPSISSDSQTPPPDIALWTGAGIRPTEQILAQLGRFLSSNQFESIEDANAAIQQFTTQGTSFSGPPVTALEQAQELIWRAAEVPPQQRRQLAKQALAICSDCVDAYTMQAELTSSLSTARELYAAGVAAGERVLGSTAFVDDAGHFWGLIETRPYMRARAGLAQVLWRQGEQGAAIGHLQDMLRLNPGDNQGLRYDLARWLLNTGDDTALTTLFEQYPDEGAADWLYTKALWLYRTKASDTATHALDEALDANAFVPTYLLGKKKLPRTAPTMITLGHADEAIVYVLSASGDWFTTPGALAWLKERSALQMKIQ